MSGKEHLMPVIMQLYDNYNNFADFYFKGWTDFNKKSLKNSLDVACEVEELLHDIAERKVKRKMRGEQDVALMQTFDTLYRRLIGRLKIQETYVIDTTNDVPQDFDDYVQLVRDNGPQYKNVPLLLLSGHMMSVPKVNRQTGQEFFSHDFKCHGFNIRRYFEKLIGRECNVYFMFPRKGFSKPPMSVRVDTAKNANPAFQSYKGQECVILCSLYRIKHFRYVSTVSMSCYLTFY